MNNFVSHCAEDTIQIAKKLANFLNEGDIVVLSGNLGSGKTKFTEGVLAYFGLQNEISSPTFTIVNEHHTEKTSIFHFDVYRLSDIDEFYAIGGEEYFENGICLIEWGELIENILPENYLKIDFQKGDDENTRILNFIPHGEKFETIVERILL